MENLTIVSATTSDIKGLRDMAHEIWHSYYPQILSGMQIDYMLSTMYSHEAIENEINKGIHWDIISFENKLAGFVSWAFEPETKKVKLAKLYVYSHLHGKGIGQAVLQYVCANAKALNVSEVYLTVNKNNIRAIKAYQKAGFVHSKSEVFDIGRGFVMDDFVMTKTI